MSLDLRKQFGVGLLIVSHLGFKGYFFPIVLYLFTDVLFSNITIDLLNVLINEEEYFCDEIVCIS